MNDFANHAMLRHIAGKLSAVTDRADSLINSDEKIKQATKILDDCSKKVYSNNEEFKESINKAQLSLCQLSNIIEDLRSTTNKLKRIIHIGWAVIAAIGISALVSRKAHAFDYVQVVNSTNTPVNINGSVTGSFTASPSTSTVPIGFVSGISTVTVSGTNPLPISGSFTANPSTSTVPIGWVIGSSTFTVTSSSPLPANVSGSTVVITLPGGSSGLSVTATNTGFTASQGNGGGPITAWTQNITQWGGANLTTSNPLPVHDTGTATVILTTSTNKIGNVDFYATAGTIFSTVTINTANTGTTVIVSTVSAQYIFVYRMFFTVSAPTTINIRNGGGFSYSGPLTFNSGGSFTVDFQGDPWFVTDIGTSFEINQTGTAQISGRVYYLQGITSCTGGICSGGTGSSQ